MPANKYAEASDVVYKTCKICIPTLVAHHYFSNRRCGGDILAISEYLGDVHGFQVVLLLHGRLAFSRATLASGSLLQKLTK